MDTQQSAFPSSDEGTSGSIWSMIVPEVRSKTLEEMAKESKHPHKVLTEKGYQEKFKLTPAEEDMGKGEIKAQLGLYSPNRIEATYIATMSDNEWQRTNNIDAINSKLIAIANIIGYKMHEIATEGKNRILRHAEPNELLRSIIQEVGSNHTGDNYKLRVDVLVQENKFMLAISDNSTERDRLEPYKDVSALRGNTPTPFFDHAQFIPTGKSGILIYSKNLNDMFRVELPTEKEKPRTYM